MYCAACNLHYPDHLSFCRRCGKSLVRSASDPVMDSVCCTRCGARTVRGENFCQHCGNRILPTGQETVVGACYHCGTAWRSGWLFCKTCGLDRDRALLLPTSLPATPSSSQKTLLSESDELSQIEKLFCKRCGAESKPYSRFCESCGNTLGLSKEAVKEEVAYDEEEDGVNTGKLLTPPAPAAFRTQTDASLSKLQTAPSDRSQRPTLIESPSEVGAGGRRTGAIGEPSLTTNLARATETVATGSLADAGADMVVSSFPVKPPPAGHPKDPSRLVQKSDSVGAMVVWAIIIVLTLAAGFVAWRLLITQKQGASPAADQTGAQSTSDAATTASPVISPNAAQPATESAPAPEGMVFVPGGIFNMGRDGGDEFESPAYTMSVKPFFIDRTEVTNEEYQRFVSGTDHRAPIHWVDGKFPEGQAKLPVVNVSWDDAKAYAEWANKRLPTEAEWEFAARGSDGRVYPWGAAWGQGYANIGREKGGSLVEVGRYPAGASPFGALDMCGNVWEWTAGDYRDYPGRKTPSPLAGAGLKVIRGGAYDVSPKRATTTYRGAISPDRTLDKTGFRCARDAQ